MASKVTCSSCGWSWNKSDSSKKDLYVCHQCGKDNTMKDGGWLNKFEDTPDAQNGIEGTMGGLTDKGFNYNGAWGGTMQMGGSLPGSVGHMYARTISPAPSNGPYAKKTKASAQTGESVVKSDTGGGDTPNDGYIPIPGGFNRTITTGVSETFDPTNPKWRGNDSRSLQMKIKNDSLMANLIADAKSLPKSEWKKKYEGKYFDVWNGYQPINPNHYDEYKNDYATNEDWIRSSHQAENELKMLNTFNVNKEKFKKEASDFINQYKNQNEFLSNFPTEAAKKYGYTPGETLNPNEFLSKDVVSKAYQAINSNKGFPLPQDPTNEMTCINGICTLESMIGVDFSPLKGKLGVYYDPKTGYTIPQYNPTFVEDNNYAKVGYRKLNPNEAPEAGDLAQYTNEGKPRHMELVLGYNPNRQALIVYNNYSQTNDNKPGEGKELRPFEEGTYKPYQFEKTDYFRLTPEAAQKAASVNPGYPKWQQEKMEAKKALESSEDYKKFIEAQNLIKTNKEKYDKYSKMSEEWWNWRNGGKTSAQNGQEMRFYQEGLDWKPKNISKDGGWLSKYEEGGIIEDPMGQWAHPGEITRIPSNQITMQGVDYPVLGISDTGDTKMMQPGEDYTYDGKSVTEIPMAQKGKIVPLRDLMKQEDEKLKAKSDNTKAVQPKKVSKQEANLNKFRMEQAERNRQLELSKKGQSDFTNAISDIATGIAIEPTQFRLPTQEEYEAGRSGDWSQRAPMLAESLGYGLFNEMTGAAMQALPGALSRASKFLTEETALKNAYKINPWAYQYNLPKDVMYRGIGEAGMKDAIESGIFRAKPNVEVVYSPGTNLRLSKQFNNAYYSPKFNIADRYGEGYIAEVPKSASSWGQRYKGKKDWSQIARRDIPTIEGRILQKDWLQGYKEPPKKEDGGIIEYPMAQDGITRGGYDDPDYVTGTSRRAFNKMVGMGNYLVPANAINSAADLAKAKGLDYGAITSGPADAVRHAAAAASVASRLPVPKFIGQYSPDLDRAIRIAGANLLGIGNEVMSLNPEGLLMDIKNNYQGSLIGSIPGLNDKTRNKMIINQLQKGKLTVDNPNKPKKENGGWLNKYK